jgi:VCBS repeat-containing protein
MKVLERSKLPDGTDIQLEDWHENNTPEFPDLYGFTIGAYPIAKNTGKWKIIRGGEKFRLSINQNKYHNYTNENVKADYEALKSGEKTLQDLVKYFHDGEQDMWYLGMDVEYKGW